MPISPITLQRRHAELGRIRLGNQVTTQSGKSRPNKLDRFRFTSVSERYIRDLAELYGGEAKSWDNNGIASWEVYSEAQSIPVIVVKGGLSQWMETWSGGGCTHRCDGFHNVLTDTDCNPEDPAHQAAKPTTRLSVMLPDLEAIGVFRMESHGWNAAAEVPAVAELAQFVGELVPANLHLVERRSVKDGQTSRFVVPVLDLQIGTARLKEIVAAKSGQGPSAIGGAGPAALESGAAPLPSADDIRGAADVRTVYQICNYLKSRDAFTPALEEIAKARVDELEDAPDEGQAPDADGAVDADVVDPPPAGDDGDAVWQRILAETGKLGWSLEQTKDDFLRTMDGLSPAVATAGELQVYLDQVLTGEPVAS